MNQTYHAKIVMHVLIVRRRAKKMCTSSVVQKYVMRSVLQVLRVDSTQLGKINIHSLIILRHAWAKKIAFYSGWIFKQY